MLVSIVVPEKLPGQKRCDEEKAEKEEKEENDGEFWAFLTSFYSNLDMTICNVLMSMCSLCGGQHTDTNIWSTLSFFITQGVAKIQP